MPIQRCTLPEGGEGYRWGSSGHCYADRADAEKQAQAAYANGYNGDDDLAEDAEHWITTEGGSHLLIEGEGSKYTVKAGAGGRLNGLKVNPQSMSKSRGGSTSNTSSQQSTTSPKVQDFEQYAAERGAYADFGEVGMHKTSKNVSQVAHKRHVEGMIKRDFELGNRREDLRKEYESEVAAGRIRAPSRIDKLKVAAAGHPDLPATQAAKRILAKMEAAERDKSGGAHDSEVLAIAMDRSVRRYDQDGHMFIEVANLSAACVSPYNATEIPDWDKLGLTRNNVYYLLRDPKALEESAASFCGKPLLMMHRAINAEDHPHKIVVGAIGSDVRYEKPFLKGSLSVWDKDAIQAIESGEQKDLSMGYYYKAVMEPGTYEGVPFDGRMVAIQGNHGAIVVDGRVPGAMVGDSAIPLVTIPETPAEATPQPATKPQPSAALDQKASPRNFKDLSAMPKANASLSRQALLTSGALRAYLLPKMAADAQIDLNPILKPVTGKNWQTQKPKVAAAIKQAADGKLAQDADLEDLLGLLDALEDIPEATAAVDEDPDDDDDDEKKRKAKEAAEKLKEAADKKGAKDRKSAKDESDDDDDDDKKKSASDEGEEDDDDDEEEKKRKAKEAAEKLKEAAKDRKGAKDKAKGMDAEPTVTKAAMDAAIASAVKIAADSAAKAAEASTIARLRAIADAEKAVRPYIGELAIACDSAADVYRLALDAADVDLDGVPEAAFPAMVKLLPKPGDQVQVVAKVTRLATDSATLSARSQMFPNANRLRSAH